MNVRRMKKAVKKRYGAKCYICGNKEEKLTLDHFQPVSKGGKDTVDNLRLCCTKCNREKADEYPITVAELRRRHREYGTVRVKV